MLGGPICFGSCLAYIETKCAVLEIDITKNFKIFSLWYCMGGLSRILFTLLYFLPSHPIVMVHVGDMNMLYSHQHRWKMTPLLMQRSLRYARIHLF